MSLNADENVSTDHIVFAKRVGTAKGDVPRMVLVKFDSFDCKLKIFGRRDDLRKSGIRVANDLTTRQREILKDLNSRGRHGYFKAGKLHVLPPKQNDSDRDVFVSSRVYRRGVRTLADKQQQAAAAAGDQDREQSIFSSNVIESMSWDNPALENSNQVLVDDS